MPPANLLDPSDSSLAESNGHVGTSVSGFLKNRPLRIQPSRGWAVLNLYELWEFRDLFLILAGRDVKLRYKQTVLGALWVILQPLLASLIFTAIFGRLARLPSDGHPYLLFVYAGMLPWNLFAGSLQRAGNSLISDSRLISKVYFPRMILPMASSAAVLIDFCVALGVMLALMLFYHSPITWSLALLPAIVGVALLVSIGISLWISALNVYYRDFMHAMPFVLQVWMYASPLVYSASMIPEKYQWLYFLNPMVGTIEGFRWSLLGGVFPWVSLGATLAAGGLVFIGGMFFFRRIERGFADVI